MDVSIIICTANRATVLRDTLASLANVRLTGSTELLVMDNRSTDETPAVVAEAAETYPFPIRYSYVAENGKYAALNAGIEASTGAVIMATDDDARFDPAWVERAVSGLQRHHCDFVGGRVLPLWGGQRPAWLNERDGLYSKVVALLDHGDTVREFGSDISWPLGVSVAYRRSVFERVGLFDNRLGRMSGTLRNQAQREWHLRARALGVRGFYLPDMVVHHLVPLERLNKQYFRRWLYWHGKSRALLFLHAGFDMEEPEMENPTHAGERRLGGVPVHLMRKAVRFAAGYIWRGIKGDSTQAFCYELWLCFFAGVVRQRWADRKVPVAAGPAPGAPSGRRASEPSRAPMFH